MSNNEKDIKNLNLYNSEDNFNDKTFKDLNNNTVVYDNRDLEQLSNDNEYNSISDVKENDFKRRTNKSFFRWFWITMVVLISIVVSKYILFGIADMLAITRRDDSAVSIYIPPNASFNGIVKILNKDGIIDNPMFFKLYSKITKSSNKLTNGSYEIKKNMDYEALINFMRNQTNRLDVVKVTFQEGLNVLQCADLLQKEGICNKDKFLEVCNSDIFDSKYDFLSNINNSNDIYYKLEGFLFPDTHQFYISENTHDVVQKFILNFNKKISMEQNIDGYDKSTSIVSAAKDKGMTILELITIASIIQSEALNTEDMYNISSVIRNRLNTIPNDGVSNYGEAGLGYLCMDSTIWYPYKSSSEAPAGFESKYDTYNIQGLPPGPISNPGLEAINAAINPNNTDYYYFCHSSSGEAYYAKTLEQHQRNLVSAGLR